MIAPKIFLIGSNTVFQSDFPIKGVDYVDIFTSTSGLVGSYTKLNKSSYEVINDSIVFPSVPSGLYLRMIVVTSREESTNTPNSLSTVFAYLEEIKTVADNIDKLGEIYNAISLITPEYKDVGFTVESQKTYLVDATLISIDISIDEDTQCFIIRDFNSTFDLHNVTVFIGASPYVLSSTHKYYQFVRHLNTYRVYDYSGALITVVGIV